MPFFDPVMQETFIRLSVAALCGMLLGLDREVKNHPAGVRTFMLVALGSAGFSVVVTGMMGSYSGQQPYLLTIDPGRIVDGIAGGIGFLGAGAIIQSRGTVRGMTTGAGIWVAGAIGSACGFGFYWHAAILTFIAFIALTVVAAIRKRLPRRPHSSQIDLD